MPASDGATFYCVMCGRFYPTNVHACDQRALDAPAPLDEEIRLAMDALETTLQRARGEALAEPPVMLYLVTMEGVYDHGTGGVFTDREAAEAHATALGRDSDGYHTFRVEELPLDHPVEPEQRRRGGPYGLTETPWPHRVEVEFVPWGSDRE